MSMQSKEQRHEVIVELIGSSRIETQADLVNQMKQRGFKVTQTTISRDIESLHIVKGPKGYELPSDMSFAPSWEQVVKVHCKSIDGAGDHLLVLKTSESAAQMVATEMDRNPIEGVVGTLAGIDTVFIAMESKLLTQKLLLKIRQLI